MQDISNPLSEKHLQDINDHLANLTKADAAITKAEMAGIALPGRRDDVAKARAQLVAIKQVYFPGR